MPKNIVVLSDGTGQEGGKGADLNTNVYKLFNMLEDRTVRQVVFYDPGLGTGWRKITGSIAGAGLSRNVRQAYRFIFDHYEAGDRIFLIGFSRGATTVRSLAGFINHFGILPKSRPDLIARAYKIYKTRAPLSKKWAARRVAGYPVYDTNGPRWKRWAKRLVRRPIIRLDLNELHEVQAGLLPRGWVERAAKLLKPSGEGDSDERRGRQRRGRFGGLGSTVAARDAKAMFPEYASDPVRLKVVEEQLRMVTRYALEFVRTFPHRESVPQEYLRGFKLVRRAKDLVVANHSQRVAIHFLGCFDTVAALGLPFPGANAIINLIPGLRHKFHNLSLPRSVQNAYQALALDDRRKVFKPEIWESKFKRRQVLHQVWFAGMHTDVGGGYKEGGLADITLSWMLHKAHGEGLLLYHGHKELLVEDATDVMHDSRGRVLTRLLYRRQVRDLSKGTKRFEPTKKTRLGYHPASESTKPYIHASVIERARATPIQRYRKTRWWRRGKVESVPGERYRERLAAMLGVDAAMLGVDEENLYKEKPYEEEPWDRYDDLKDRLIESQEVKWRRWVAESIKLDDAPEYLSAADTRAIEGVVFARKGDRGPAVQYWQYRLLRLDGESLPNGADGRYDDEMAAAVAAALDHASDGEQIGPFEAEGLDALAAGKVATDGVDRLAAAEASDSEISIPPPGGWGPVEVA